MDAAEVKALAKSYGADLVGIASAKVLNAFPPDPQWPQTPERISPYVKSVIVIVQHIPVAVFRAKTGIPVQYMDMLVLRRMDRIAHRLAETLAEAKQRGDLPSEIDPLQSANLMIDCWEGAAARSRLLRSAAPLESAMDVSFRTVLT